MSHPPKLPLCQWTNRKGGPCKKPAGWRTDHPGKGNCRFHGGATPMTHGRYSKLKPPRYQELYDQFVNDPDPLDLLPELAHARAIFVDFIARYQETRDALLAWHASFGKPQPEAKPRHVLDLSDARHSLLVIAKIVDTIERIRATVGRNDLLRIMGEMGHVVEVNVATLVVQMTAMLPEDLREKVAVAVEEKRKAIEAGWLSIPMV
jgi:hypothetical protein